MRIYARIEAGFEAWGRLVVRRRYTVVLVMLGLSAILTVFIPRLRVDNSIESFLRPNDPAREDYDRFREQFGQDSRILLAIRPPRIFDLDFLERLRTFHEELEREVPHVLEVTSLVNARNTRGEGDELIVEDLMESWPSGPEDLARLERRVLENPLYRNTLINEEATLTTVSIKPLMYSASDDDLLAGFEPEHEAGDRRPVFLTDAEDREHVEGVEAVIARYQAPDFQIHAAGAALGGAYSKRLMVRDARVFMPLAVAVVAALLLVLFRRVSGVLLPLGVVLLSLLATYGIMALAGIPASVSGQMLAPLLLTVGICSAVHVLIVVYERLGAGDAPADAIPFALGHTGLAILTATLTTAAGLFSFTAGELAQVVNLGLIAPIGIVLTFVYSVTLLPAALAIAPLGEGTGRGGVELRRFLGAQLARIGALATRHPWRALAGTACVTLCFVPGVARLEFSQYRWRWLPEDDPVRLDSEFIDRELRGATTLEMIVDTGRANGLHEPDVLDRIERASRFAESHADGEIFVGKAISIVDIVKETHKALNENRHSHYVIPRDRQLVAQELLLFEMGGTDDLAELTDTKHRLARVSLRVPFVDAFLYPGFIDEITRGFEEILGDVAEIRSTGIGALSARTYSVLNETMTRSYVVAFLAITPLMVLLIGDLKRGLLAMIPNLLPIFLTLGLMGWLGIVIDNSTLLVGCVLLGLVVDDTIHFLHKFQRHYEAGGDAAEAVQRTLQTTGSALLFTTLVLAAGWTVITFSYMRNVAEFGQLTLFATLVAFAADIVVSPALMVLVSKSGRDPRTRAERHAEGR